MKNPTRTNQILLLIVGIVAILSSFSYFVFQGDIPKINWVPISERASIFLFGISLLFIAYGRVRYAFISVCLAMGIEFFHLFLFSSHFPFLKGHSHGQIYHRAFIIYFLADFFVMVTIGVSLLLAMISRLQQLFSWIAGLLFGFSAGLLLISFGAFIGDLESSGFWGSALTLNALDSSILLLITIVMLIYLGQVVTHHFDLWLSLVIAIACAGGAVSSWAAFSAREKILISQDESERGRMVIQEANLESLLYFEALKRFAIRWEVLPQGAHLVKVDGQEYLKDFPFLQEIVSDREQLDLKRESISLSSIQNLLKSKEVFALETDTPRLNGAVIQGSDFMLINWFETRNGEKIYFVADFSSFLRSRLTSAAFRKHGYAVYFHKQQLGGGSSDRSLPQKPGTFFDWNYFGLPLKLEVWPIESKQADVVAAADLYHLIIGIIFSISLGAIVYFMLQAVAKHRKAEELVLEKNFFFGNISHELRTPLQGILGALSILEATEISEKQQPWVDGLHNSAHTLHHLVSELIDLSNMELGKITSQLEALDLFELGTFIEHRSAALAEKKQLTFEFLYASDLPLMFFSDRLSLRQALTNIVLNAVKYTQRGGIRMIFAGKRLRDNHYNLELSVEDTGVGISPDLKKNLFEKYKRMEVRHESGSGIGLAIVKRLVTQLGGTITVESEVNVGTKFTIHINMDAVENDAAEREERQ